MVLIWCLECIANLKLKHPLILSSILLHNPYQYIGPSTAIYSVLALLTRTLWPSFLSLTVLYLHLPQDLSTWLNICLSRLPPHCQVTSHSTCRFQQKCHLLRGDTSSLTFQTRVRHTHTPIITASSLCCIYHSFDCTCIRVITLLIYASLSKLKALWVQVLCLVFLPFIPKTQHKALHPSSNTCCTYKWTLCPSSSRPQANLPSLSPCQVHGAEIATRMSKKDHHAESLWVTLLCSKQ